MAKFYGQEEKREETRRRAVQAHMRAVKRAQGLLRTPHSGKGKVVASLALGKVWDFLSMQLPSGAREGPA